MTGLAFCDDWAEKFAAVNHPRNRSHGLGTTNERLLQISARCVNKFMEVTLDELESAELAPLLRIWRRDEERSADGFERDRSGIYGGFHCYARC